MRKPIALCAAFAVAAFSFVASEAQEVRIGDFVFGCKTSDGQVRKPQFGDMNGVFYTDIRGQEKACRDAVKRMIANCHQHTRFLRPADNRQYPECLPVFQEQANECASFFREEIARCSGDGAAAESAATTHGVFTLPEGHDHLSGWRYEGPMRAGKPHGRGTLTAPEPSTDFKAEAEFHHGKLHGRSIVTQKFSYVGGGSGWSRLTQDWRNGKVHGRSLHEESTGTRNCQEFENGEFISLC